MNIGILAVDSNFPNLALMKISAYHKARGDQVEWYNPLCKYDKVYAAKVFTFTPDYNYYINANQIDMSELYIPPERFERDFITGRFLKGCVSRNKGRKMVYHSKRSKARSIKNLSKGRGAWHKTGAGMNKKSVVLIKDEKLCGVFPSIQMAGKMIGVAPSLISAICRKVRGKHTANGYRCFFEDSNDWYNLIKQDYE
jgi:hypothetical protein